MLKKWFLILVLLPMLLQAGRVSQSSNEIGVFLGGAYYMGDLNPSRHFLLTQPAAGVMFKHYFNPRWGVRGNFMFGQIVGDDAQSDSYSQQQRNLNFKSNVMEISAMVEFNFYSFEMGGKPVTTRNATYDEHPFSPYVFLGLGYFNYNPYTTVSGYKYYLQELGTEGQGTSANPEQKYSLYQFSIPFGVGMRVALTRTIGLSLEWGMRKTFTDYLDDVSGYYVDPAVLSGNAAFLADRSRYAPNTVVSNVGRQRGNPRTNDWYNFTGLTLSFKLGKGEKPCSSYRGNKLSD